MTVLAYVALGSNLDAPARQLATALDELDHLPATRLIASSSMYVTAPVGARGPQPDYLNAVALLRTGLAPRKLMRALQRLERAHRRERGARNAPRTLDLDLLLYGALRCRRPSLTVPHPRMHRRAFVLLPLLEIAPSVDVPGLGSALRFLPSVRRQRAVRAE